MHELIRFDKRDFMDRSDDAFTFTWKAILRLVCRRDASSPRCQSSHHTAAGAPKTDKKQVKLHHSLGYWLVFMHCNWIISMYYVEMQHVEYIASARGCDTLHYLQAARASLVRLA